MAEIIKKASIFFEQEEMLECYMLIAGPTE